MSVQTGIKDRRCEYADSKAYSISLKVSFTFLFILATSEGTERSPYDMSIPIKQQLNRLKCFILRILTQHKEEPGHVLHAVRSRISSVVLSSSLTLYGTSPLTFQF